MTSFIEMLNQWGGQFLKFAWPVLWQSSLLIAIIFVLELALRRKIRAAIRYVLWLMVLVKLLLPPSLALPTSLAWWLLPSPQSPAKPPTTAFVVTYGDQAAPTFSLQSQPAPALVHPKMSSAAWTLAASSAVSAGLLAWLLVRWWQIIQKVRCAKNSEKLVPVLDEARCLTRLRPGIRLKLTEDSMSPAVCGLFRPVILLPQSLMEKLSAGQLRAVLLHEAIHLRRGDVWVNCAQALLQIFYWWHPLLWLANARIRRVREEAVDDAVMLALRDDAEIYAPTLLEVAKLAFNRPLASLGLVGILESRSALRQRIERLMDFNAPRKAGLTAVSVLGILAFSAVALPMGQAPEKTNAEAVSLQKDDNTMAVTNSIDGKIHASQLVQDGKLLYETGKFEDAEAKFDAALVLNPDNQAAHYYLVLVAQARHAPKSGGPKLIYPRLDNNLNNLSNRADDAQSDATRVFQINQPTKEDDLKKHLLDAGVKIPPTVFVYTDGGILLVRGSEQQLVLIERVVQKLNGFSFTETNTIYPVVTATNLKTNPAPASKWQPARSAGIFTNLNANPTIPNLEERVFKVDPRTFITALGRIPGLQTNNVATMAESLFSKFGVDLTLAAPGRSLAYNDGLGLLFVRATPSELDTVERVVQALNQTAPQIHIKARFIEVPRKGFVMPQLFTNAVAGPMTGILSDSEFRTVLRALEQRQGVETLAEPECVTTSGRQTQMRSTTIMNILPNFTILETSSNSTPNTPKAEKVEVGPVLDVVPYVLADGYTINLNVTASVIAFLGYDNTTEPNRPQPGFRVQKIKTTTNLWDNQTLVLGNLKSDFLDGDGQIQNESKFFQDAEKKNGTADKELLVFITATIVDPAGNRVHSDDDLPFNPSTIPPQPQISTPSP